MLKPFFTGAELPVMRQESTLPQCGACGFHKNCKHPKIRVSGEGRKGILFVGRFPEEREDRTGNLLAGDDAQTVRHAVGRQGINLDRDCWWTNSFICKPTGKKKQREFAVDYCRPNLVKLLQELKPRVVVPLGSEAVMSVFSWLWKPGEGGVHRFRGFRVPNRRLNAWVCPTWHPAMLIQEKDPVYDRQFQTDIKEALALKDRPYKEGRVPPRDEGDSVEVIKGVWDAVRMIRFLHKTALKHDIPVSWDFETNCRKPHGPRSQIFSCAVCVGGERTVAYPWTGVTMDATRQMLEDKRVKKIGANIKFEDQWCILNGITVRGWWWDVNLTAHALWNASKVRNITPVDFQAVVCLGVDGWDGEISPYLTTPKQSGGYAVNRIKEADLTKLLRYNGLDALYEYQIAMHQRRLLGLKEERDES